jgi:cysteine desulfurase
VIRAYLDANATTRPLPEVVEAVRHAMETDFVNASSAAAAMWSSDGVGAAKRALARLLDAETDEFALTSGASESNSWVVASVAASRHMVVSGIEHPSLHEAAAAARRRGVLVTEVPSDCHGVVDVDAVASAVTDQTDLVSVMLANNETGVLQPVAAMARAVHARSVRTLFHTDATQAVGRLPLSLADELADVDLLSLSAHKFHGPKGVGALYQRGGVRLAPLVHGEQEGGSRGGTYNSPALAGMVVAADAMGARLSEWSSRIRELRDRTEADLLLGLPGSFVNGAGALRLPNTISLTVPGLDAAALVDALAARGVCAATGSACSAGANAPSRTLLSMGLSPDQAFATLRLSLSIDTTPADVALLLGQLTELKAMAA